MVGCALNEFCGGNLRKIKKKRIETDTKKEKKKPKNLKKKKTANTEQSKFNKKLQIPFVDFVISNNSNAKKM